MRRNEPPDGEGPKDKIGAFRLGLPKKAWQGISPPRDDKRKVAHAALKLLGAFDAGTAITPSR